MNEESKRLLEMFKDAEGPSAAREASILDGLSSRASAGDAGPDLPGPESASSTGLSAAAKAGLAALGAAVIAAPVVWVLSGDDPKPVGAAPPAEVVEALGPAQTKPETSETPSAEPPAVVPQFDPAEPPHEHDDAGAEPTEDEPTKTPAAKRAPKTREPAAQGGDVQAELALMQRARGQLAKGNAKQALGTLQEHARTFPKGVLVEERLVSKARALCDLGRRAQARKQIRVFLKRYPNSPLRDRARGICTDDQKE